MILLLMVRIGMKAGFPFADAIGYVNMETWIWLLFIVMLWYHREVLGGLIKLISRIPFLGKVALLLPFVGAKSSLIGQSCFGLLDQRSKDYLIRAWLTDYACPTNYMEFLYVKPYSFIGEGNYRSDLTECVVYRSGMFELVLLILILVLFLVVVYKLVCKCFGLARALWHAIPALANLWNQAAVAPPPLPINIRAMAGLVFIANPVGCGLVEPSIGFEFVIDVILILFAIGWLVDLWANYSRFPEWDEFKEHVERFRMTYDVIAFAIRPGDGIDNFECETPLDGWPQNPHCEIKFKWWEDDYIVPRQAVTAVGVCFDTAAPHVDDSSQYTVLAAVKTRATLDVEAPEDPSIMSVLLPYEPEIVIGNNLYPTCRGESFEFAGEEWKMKELVSFKEYRSRFPPNKQKMLDEAKEELDSGLFEFKWLSYGVFVKKEKEMKITKEPFAAKSPHRPRVISACSQYVKVLAGVWFLMYSYALKHTWNMLHYIWFASGYTTKVFNCWFEYHINRLGGVDNLIFFGSDFGKYDLTQGYAAISFENDFYERLGFCRVVKFGKAILRSKLLSILIATRKGFKYNSYGLRKSGDNDTSSGNSKLTGTVILSFLGKYMGIMFLVMHVAISVLGDDNFTMMTKAGFQAFVNKIRLGIVPGPKKGTDYELFVGALEHHASSLGFRLKIQISQNPTTVEYLSCRYYPVKPAHGVRFAIGKKPGRVLTKIGYMMTRAGRRPEDYTRCLLGTLLSYRSTSMHVPFLRVYIQTLIDYLVGVKPIFDEAVVKYMLKGEEVYECSPETWEFFTETYGLDAADEGDFKAEIESALEKFGIPMMLGSAHIDIMFAVDSAM